MKDGVVSSYKSRFCADGSKSYFDKEEVFSPVARTTSLRLIYALATIERRTLRSGDVPSAYVKSPLPDGVDLYMRQPQGFEELGKRRVGLQAQQIDLWLPTFQPVLAWNVCRLHQINWLPPKCLQPLPFHTQ